VGAGESGLRFRLLPGGTLRIAVTFTPTAPGRSAGELVVVRDGGRQPDLHAELFGRSVAIGPSSDDPEP
jgi:hypothetical protein